MNIFVEVLNKQYWGKSFFFCNRTKAEDVFGESRTYFLRYCEKLYKDKISDKLHLI